MYERIRNLDLMLAPSSSLMYRIRIISILALYLTLPYFLLFGALACKMWRYPSYLSYAMWGTFLLLITALARESVCISVFEPYLTKEIHRRKLEAWVESVLNLPGTPGAPGVPRRS